LNSVGFSSWSGSIYRDGEIFLEFLLDDFEPSNALVAYEVDADQMPVAISELTIEGRFYIETDLDYQDLSVGMSLASAPDAPARVKVRITASPGAEIVDKHVRFEGLST
jgi:hypothetical protein